MKYRLKDKFNRDYKVYHGPLDNSPCYSMHLFTWAEMVDKGWAQPIQGWQSSSRVVAITDPESNKCVGYLCYQDGDGETVWVTLTTVVPGYRGRGLHKAMYELFENIQIERGKKSISSLVHVNNDVAIKNIKETGRELLFYKAYKELPRGT